MKKYNEELIQKTRGFSQKTVYKSMETVRHLTHPPKKISLKGSIVGGSLGVIFIIVGVVGLILENSLLGLGSLTVGISTILSNALNIQKIK